MKSRTDRINFWLFSAALLVVSGAMPPNSFSQSARPLSVQSNDAIIYHGKLVKPDGKVVEGSVGVTVKIFSPEPELCLLWKETQSVTAVKGAFSMELGHVDNRASSGAGSASDSAPTFRDVFLNASTLSYASSECASGYSSYTPSSTDDRLMTASFDVGGTVVSTESIPIKSVPFAKQASEIGGFGPNNLMKISGAGSSVQFTPTEVQSLKDLLGGSIDWNLGGQQLTNIADPVAGTDATNKQWVIDYVANNSGGGTLDAAAITGALGYTPISSTSSSEVQAALGFTPVNRNGDTMNGALNLPANGFSVGSNQLVVSGGNVGIGTSSPSNSMQIVGTFSSTSSQDIAKTDSTVVPSGNQGSFVMNDAMQINATIPSTNSVNIGRVRALVADATSNHNTGTVQWLQAINGFSYQATSGATNVINGGSLSSEVDAGTVTQLSGGLTWTGVYGGAVTYQRALDGTAEAAGGTVGTAWGLQLTQNVSGSTVGTAYGVQISNQINSGSVTGNRYGLYLSSTGTVGGSDYGIYQATSTQLNYFAGNIGIGTTSPASKLDIAGTVRAQEICDETGANCKDISTGWNVGGSGTVTNVSAASGMPLSVTNGSSSPEISITQATSSTPGFLTASDWQSFNNKLGPTLATGQVWVGSGSNVATPVWFGVDDLRTAAGLQQFAASCTAAQTLTWSTVTDAFSCTNIALGDSAITYTNKDQNEVLAGPSTGGAGAPTFRALVEADIPSLDASKIAGGTISPARLGSGIADSSTFLRGDGTWAAPGGGASSNYQAFTSSGTWTKPSSGNVAFVECWGAGGGGAKGTNPGGGGGGSYVSMHFPLSALPANISVTIGAGGIGPSVNGNGGNGGDSYFGTHLVAYGGGGGTEYYGGGGGGAMSAGVGTSPGNPPPIAFTDLYSATTTYQSHPYGGGQTIGATESSVAQAISSIYGGGGGGMGDNDSVCPNCVGGKSLYGGAGGSGGATVSIAATAGIFGGSGGAGNATTSGGDGSVPGGGGGGTRTGPKGGDGGSGLCRITVH